MAKRHKMLLRSFKELYFGKASKLYRINRGWYRLVRIKVGVKWNIEENRTKISTWGIIGSANRLKSKRWLPFPNSKANIQSRVSYSSTCSTVQFIEKSIFCFGSGRAESVHAVATTPEDAVPVDTRLLYRRNRFGPSRVGSKVNLSTFFNLLSDSLPPTIVRYSCQNKR